MMNEKDYELICAYMANELPDPERKKVQALLLEDQQCESKFLEFSTFCRKFICSTNPISLTLCRVCSIFN